MGYSTLSVKRFLSILVTTASVSLAAIAQNTVTIEGMTFRTKSGTECALSSVSETATSISVPSTVTIGTSEYQVTSVGNDAAKDRTALTEVTLPTSLKSIGRNAFDGCTAIKSFIIPEGVTSIDSYSFNNCTALEELTVPSTLTTTGTSVFYGCDAMNRVNAADLSSWCGISFNDAESNPVSKSHSLFIGGKELKELVIPEGITEVKPYAFYGLSALTEVTIPSTVKTFGSQAFTGCSSLKAVNTNDLAAWCDINFSTSTSNPVTTCHTLKINGQELSEVTIPEGATTIKQYVFSGCASISSMKLPSTLGSIGRYAFYNCTGLKTIEIPETVTTIGSSAFASCTGLSEITIPSGVTLIDQAVFNGCKSLKSVTLPENLTEIKQNAFINCAKLESIIIPDKTAKIGNKAFQNCSGLASVSFPEKMTSLGDYTFQGTALESAYLPEDLTKIGYNVFLNCDKLVTVSIPSTVTSIDANAFGNCTAIATIICKATAAPAANERSFAAAIYPTAELLVPEGSKNSYATAAVWSEFQSIAESDFSAIDGIESDMDNATISVWTISGILVYTGKADNLDSLEPGMYIVTDGKSSKKVLISK